MLVNETNMILKTHKGGLGTGVMRSGTHQKSLLPLTACVPELRTLTEDTMSSCSYLQNLLTMSVSFSSSSHNSTAPVGDGEEWEGSKLGLHQDSNSLLGLHSPLPPN